LIEHVRTGKLRALAVTTAKRSEVLPDIPTVSEFLPGFEASVWFGIGAPNNTPVDIVNKLNKLNKEINAGLAESQDQGAACGPGRPATFGLARRLWQSRFGRNREVGESDTGGQHQARLIVCRNPGQIFRNARCAMSLLTLLCIVGWTWLVTRGSRQLIREEQQFIVRD